MQKLEARLDVMEHSHEDKVNCCVKRLRNVCATSSCCHVSQLSNVTADAATVQSINTHVRAATQ
jgi:hypothetical protein